MTQNTFQKPLTSSVAIIIVLAVLSSSFTLWLIQSSIRYALFAIELGSILVTYFILNKYDLGLRLDPFKKLQRRLGFIFDLSLVSFSALLAVINGFHLSGGGIIQLLITFVSISFLIGYSLLNLLRVTKHFSNLEVVLFSYLLSFIFSGFSTLAFLSINQETRGVIISILFFVIGTISVLRRIKNTDSIGDMTSQTHSFKIDIDIVALALSISFYLVFFYYTYPNFAVLEGSDISRHYSDSIILSRSPDLYTQFPYILFHGFEGTFQVLSGLQQPLETFQSVLVMLNIFLPVSVYVLAKRFLGNLDKRIPALATIFYTILSNFAFIYFAQLKLLHVSGLDVQSLAFQVSEKAFTGNVNFLQPFPWFVPLSISFVLFVAAYILLRVHTLPRLLYIPLYSILVLAMYLTHTTESVIFGLFIAVYGLVTKSNVQNELRLNDALLSSLIGFIAVGAFSVYTSFLWKSEVRSSNFDYMIVVSSILPIFPLAFSIYWRIKLVNRLGLKLRIHVKKRFYLILSVLLVCAYLFGFFTWFFIEDFKTSSVSDVGFTPWFIYPLMLGIVGLLTIIALRYMGNILPNNSVMIILASIVFMLVIGRLISFVNLNFITTGYWEKRVLPFIFLFSCLVAPIPLIRLVDFFQSGPSRKTKSIPTTILVGAIICGIMLSGFSTMALQSEYWFTFAQGSSGEINEKEWQAIGYLKKVLQHDDHAFTISPSSTSNDILAFAAPGYQISLRNLLFSKYPALPLMTLASHNLSHAYIYMDIRDLQFLDENPHQSWFYQHLLPMLPVAFSNGEVTIYNASHISFPSPNSETTLLIPTDSFDSSWLYAYDMISNSDKNYSVMYDLDPNALKGKDVILSFDPAESYNHYYDFSNLGISKTSNWFPISGYWNYTSGGLQGGDGKSESSEGTILSPIRTDKFTVGTTYKIIKIEPKVANYVSIIYSWHDPKNYELAGINVLNNKDIYVSWTTVSNGKIKVSPQWPGIKTNLTFEPKGLINMSLSVQNDKSGSTANLSINGTIYKHAGDTTLPGYLGLSYSRAKDVVFNQYAFLGMSKADLRPISDYIKFVHSGGHLIVLDTNRHGSIANLFHYSSMEAQVPAKQSATLRAITDYWTPLKHLMPSSPIIVKEWALGSGKVTYVNIQPILSRLPTDKILPALHKLLSVLGTNLSDSSPEDIEHIFNSHVATFRTMSAMGSITVNTSAVIFPISTQIDEMKMLEPNKREVALANVSNLQIDDYNYAILNTVHNSMSIANGTGLYSNLVFGNQNSIDKTLSLDFSSNSKRGATNITAVSNGRLFHFENISKIIIHNEEPIRIYARQPVLNINDGNTSFKELYFGHISGNDLTITGSISLSVYMSDLYTFLDHVSFPRDSYLQLPRSPYNEVTSLSMHPSLQKLYSLPEFIRFLLLIPILITFIFIVYVKPKRIRDVIQ